MADSPENSINPARAAAAKAYHERRKKQREAAAAGGNPDVEETWAEAIGNKVVQKTRMKNGNVYTVYIGTRKQCDERNLEYRR